ncbi:hypothetical protein AA313_de0206183 [Arthrobotrys entomopaga]|nr:hypothetical protein AA313_de0206183 [Arthrobotrys entomopaga]
MDESNPVDVCAESEPTAQKLIPCQNCINRCSEVQQGMLSPSAPSDSITMPIEACSTPPTTNSTGIQSPPSPQEAPENLTPKGRKSAYSYTCTRCSEVFSSRKKYGVHMRQSHNTLAFKCDDCDKQITRYDNIKSHKSSCRKLHPMANKKTVVTSSNLKPVEKYEKPDKSEKRSRVNIKDLHREQLLSKTLAEKSRSQQADESGGSIHKIDLAESQSDSTSDAESILSKSEIGESARIISRLEEKNRILQEQLEKAEEGWAETRQENEASSLRFLRLQSQYHKSQWEYFKLKKALLEMRAYNFDANPRT